MSSRYVGESKYPQKSILQFNEETLLKAYKVRKIVRNCTGLLNPTLALGVSGKKESGSHPTGVTLTMVPKSTTGDPVIGMKVPMMLLRQIG